MGIYIFEASFILLSHLSGSLRPLFAGIPLTVIIFTLTQFAVCWILQWAFYTLKKDESHNSYKNTERNERKYSLHACAPISQDQHQKHWCIQTLLLTWTDRGHRLHSKEKRTHAQKKRETSMCAREMILTEIQEYRNTKEKRK